MSENPEPSTGPKRSLFDRVARNLRPSHEHSAYSAMLLLTGAVALSRVIGYLRDAYIAWAFGAGAVTDPYVAAFTLPDFVNYLLAGGTASITFISIFTRYASQGREEQAKRTYSVVISAMTALLTLFILLAELWTPEFTRWWFPRFTPEQLAQCTYLTRILLPSQLFFVIGGVASAVLLSKRRFLVPALAPLLYNLGIIAGGVLLSRQLGIASLAYGALAGAILGPFLINYIGAERSGVRFRPTFALRDPGFVEWIWLSVPLMLGVSLVAADDWIMRHFAAGVGDITRLNYSKRLLSVPIAVLGQATGQASLPFFARLFGEKKMKDFAETVSAAIFRVGAVAFLLTAWLVAAALPATDLAFRRGQFHFSDTRETAALLLWFSFALVFWSVQGLYARAFYAAGNTLTPMVAGTIITVLSLPVYWSLQNSMGAVGLAIASDIGIAAHTVVLAILLQRNRLVPISAMPWGELAKALATAIFATAAATAVGRGIPLAGSRLDDLLALALISLTWGAAVAAGLWLLRSKLPASLRRRRAAAAPGGPA
jgi:putative peptidoglycan lipid II flippase